MSLRIRRTLNDVFNNFDSIKQFTDEEILNLTRSVFIIVIYRYPANTNAINIFIDIINYVFKNYEKYRIQAVKVYTKFYEVYNLEYNLSKKIKMLKLMYK